MAKKRIAVLKTPKGIREFTFPNILVQHKNVNAWRKAGLKVVTGKYDTKTTSHSDAFKKLRKKL